jgi:hypothetical protein
MNDRPQLPWIASEYLDDGRIGILSANNLIVVGINAGLTREQAQQIVAVVNREMQLKGGA